MTSNGEQASGKLDPGLQQFTDMANAIQKLFDQFPSALQLEALDILQNLVNCVMSKMTDGKVCSVRFVPVPAETEATGAVSAPEDEEVRQQTDVEVKQEPTEEEWSHETISSQRIGVLQAVGTSDHKSAEGSVTCESSPAEPPLMSSTPKSKAHTKCLNSLNTRSSSNENVKSLKRCSPRLDESGGKRSKRPTNTSTVINDDAGSEDGDLMDDSGIGDSALDLSSTAVEEYEDFADSETSQDMRDGSSSEGSVESKDESDSKYCTKAESVNTVLNWSRTAPKKRKKKDTSKLPFHCEHCNFATNRKYSLETHMSLHTGDSKYKCSHCDKCFTAASSLKRHMMIHDGVRPFNCPVCQKKFVDIAGLRTHSTVHTGERLFKCELCPKAYTNHANLARHKRVHTGEMPYVCKYDGCDAKFRDLSSLKLHVLKHTGEKPYSCPFCQKKFKTSSDFRRHERTHTQERNYKCTECGKTFIQGYHLKQHLKIHADLWLFSCELCKKRFRTKASLQHHMKGHAGVKDYRCEKCGSAFTTKRYLNDHYIAAHTNAKPYKCDICHKGFNHISNMKRHKRMHSDEFRYKCKFCDRGFKYINSLQYHEGIHTGEKKVCEKCGFSCRSVATIKAHRCSKKHETAEPDQKQAKPNEENKDDVEDGHDLEVHELVEESLGTRNAANEDVHLSDQVEKSESSDPAGKSCTTLKKSEFIHMPRKSKQRAIRMIESITEELNEEKKPFVSKLRIKLNSASGTPKIASKSRKKGRPRQIKAVKLTEDLNEVAQNEEDSKDNIELKIENSFSLTSEDPDAGIDLTKQNATSTCEDQPQETDTQPEMPTDLTTVGNQADSRSVPKTADDQTPLKEQVEHSSSTYDTLGKDSVTIVTPSAKNNSLMEDISIMQEAYGSLPSVAASSATSNGQMSYAAADELPNGVLGSGFEDLERCMPVISKVYSVRE